MERQVAGVLGRKLQQRAKPLHVPVPKQNEAQASGANVEGSKMESGQKVKQFNHTKGTVLFIWVESQKNIKINKTLTCRMNPQSKALKKRYPH